MRTHPIVEYYQALRDSAPCLSRAATLPKGTKLGLGKRRAPGNTIILSQPYRRRVSTDRLNREGSQLAASLEGEPGPTPAGKTLPHSFPETSRFRRERARDSVHRVFRLLLPDSRGMNYPQNRYNMKTNTISSIMLACCMETHAVAVDPYPIKQLILSERRGNTNTIDMNTSLAVCFVQYTYLRGDQCPVKKRCSLQCRFFPPTTDPSSPRLYLFSVAAIAIAISRTWELTKVWNRDMRAEISAQHPDWEVHGKVGRGWCLVAILKWYT